MFRLLISLLSLCFAVEVLSHEIRHDSDWRDLLQAGPQHAVQNTEILQKQIDENGLLDLSGLGHVWVTTLRLNSDLVISGDTRVILQSAEPWVIAGRADIGTRRVVIKDLRLVNLVGGGINLLDSPDSRIYGIELRANTVSIALDGSWRSSVADSRLFCGNICIKIDSASNATRVDRVRFTGNTPDSIAVSAKNTRQLVFRDSVFESLGKGFSISGEAQGLYGVVIEANYFERVSNVFDIRDENKISVRVQANYFSLTNIKSITVSSGHFSWVESRMSGNTLHVRGYGARTDPQEFSDSFEANNNIIPK